ncbi:MAG: chromosome segregation ATPase [Cytophaga sp.]|uniref:chromosome segregation ATPase n=1 Tax=Cytophaga sp. TaxID=29535 RepID=UPI003F800C1E
MSPEKKQVVKETKNNNKVWIIVLAVVLLAINGIQGFFNYKQNDEIKQKEQIIVQKDAQRDSLTAALTAKIEELKATSAKLEEAGGKNAELEAQIAQLEEMKVKLEKDAKYFKSQYYSIKGEINNANKLKADAEKQVADLKIQLAQQDTIINNQKTVLSQKDQMISTLDQEKAELAKKVAVASVLKAENIKVIAVSSKGKEKIGDVYKAKAIEQIKIVFTIAENKVAQKNTKDLYIRIVEPDGATITGSSSGEFKYGTQTLFYTAKTSVLYNGVISPVSVSYTKEGPYKVGKQTIEVYAEGSLIGTGSFVVE